MISSAFYWPVECTDEQTHYERITLIALHFENFPQRKCILNFLGKNTCLMEYQNTEQNRHNQNGFDHQIIHQGYQVERHILSMVRGLTRDLDFCGQIISRHLLLIYNLGKSLPIPIFDVKISDFIPLGSGDFLRFLFFFIRCFFSGLQEFNV